MKLARLDSLARVDSLYESGEPDGVYDRRQVIVVVDGYDFVTNDATDISSIPNWLGHRRKVSTREKVVLYMQDCIVTWATHDSAEKDLFLDFALHTINPTLSAAQMADIQLIADDGFTVFENGGVNLKKYWDGTSWL